MLFIFDGDCAMCSTCAQWLRDRGVAVDVVPWQRVDDLAARGITLDEVTTAVVMDMGDGTHRTGVDAIAAVLRTSTSRSVRASGATLGTRPVGLVARPVYRWVARNRHRLPGGTPECRVTPPTPKA